MRERFSIAGLKMEGAGKEYRWALGALRLANSQQGNGPFFSQLQLRRTEVCQHPE